MRNIFLLDCRFRTSILGAFVISLIAVVFLSEKQGLKQKIDFGSSIYDFDNGILTKLKRKNKCIHDDSAINASSFLTFLLAINL